MTTKRNSNIVSLTKAEKSATISALENQAKQLREEPESDNYVVRRIVANQIGLLERVMEKLSAE